MKRYLIASLTTLITLSAFAQQPNYELAARFSTNKVSKMVYSTSVRPVWFEKADKFYYRWDSSEGATYYIVDAASGQKKEAFDMEKLAMQVTSIVRDPFDRGHLPMTDVTLKDDKYFRFDIRSTQEIKDTTDKEGKKKTKKVFHFQYDLTSGELSEYKPEEKEYPSWASVSPDGEIGVYVKNRELWWMDKANMAKAAKDEKDSTIVEHRITKDAVEGYGYGEDGYHGDTETDSLARHMAYLLWSPDSKNFATIRYDMRKIKNLWVINSLSSPRPTLQSYRYQMPGEEGPKEYLYIFNLADSTSKIIKTDCFKDQDLSPLRATRKNSDRYKKYNSNVWLGDNEGFYIERLSRDAHRLDVCRVDLSSDSTKTILSERMNTYIESRGIRLVKGGKEFVFWSERNGWANLYLYKADGTLIKNLTEGAFHVENILGVNDAEGYLLCSANGVDKTENPYQEHIYKVSLSSGGMTPLDMSDMNVSAAGTVSDNAKYFVANCSRVDFPPFSELVSAAGKRVKLEEADLSKLYEAGYKLPERFCVKAADGITDLWGEMYKPYDFDSTKVYPIIEYVYPGPQVEANNISWAACPMRTARLAQMGFIVITVGNRGGHPSRSKWYHNYGYGNLRDYGLEDQKTAVERLAAKYPWIDGSRVGIHGHSGGGFMSTAAILTYPDFYKAAVSCAGNHDNSIYNRWWSETHHGIKENVSEKGDTTFYYKIATNPEIAANLKGHLMLVHGDVDDNVHPANTIRVVNALIKANKRFDMLILPGQKHGFSDMNEYFFWRMADYYSEWLLGTSKRYEPEMTELNND